VIEASTSINRLSSCRRVPIQYQRESFHDICCFRPIGMARSNACSDLSIYLSIYKQPTPFACAVGIALVLLCQACVLLLLAFTRCSSPNVRYVTTLINCCAVAILIEWIVCVCVCVCVCCSILSHIKSKDAPNAVAIRNPYLEIVGIHVDTDGTGRSLSSFTREEEQSFIELSRTPNLYDMISSSIAPAIFGHEGWYCR
jgi:hypothetical protein